MSDTYISKLSNLYDKTNLKGIYLFFSFTVISYIFYITGVITSEIITNPINSVNEYFILFSFISLTTVFLYFIKIENIIFRIYLRFKGYIIGFHSFRNVNYQDSFNSIFISRERKELISLIFIWISIIFLLLLSQEISSTYFYLGIIIIFMVAVLIFDIIIVSLKTTLNFLHKIQNSFYNSKELKTEFSKIKRNIRIEKDPKKRGELKSSLEKINRRLWFYKGLFRFYDIITPIIKHLTLTLTFVFMIIICFLIPFNPFSFFLLIFQFMILISFSLKWKELQLQIQLIYFMRLFLQEGNYSKQNDNNHIEFFIKNIQDNLWEESLFNFNLFLKIKFDPIIEHKSIQRATMMNNLQRMFNYFVEYKNTGSIRQTTPEDSNKINTHYNSVCFKLFNHLVNTYNSLDEWLKSFIKLRYYSLPNYENFFEVMAKIENFNKELTPDIAENMTKINFIEALTEKYKDYDISDFGVFEINGSYYFENAKKVFDRIEELVGDLRVILDIKETDKLDYYKSKRERKINKLVQKELDSIREKLNDLKSRGQLEDFLSKSLRDDYWKLESDLKYYNESALPDLFFIESCSRTLGKKFIKIFKKTYRTYEKENRSNSE